MMPKANSKDRQAGCVTRSMLKPSRPDRHSWPEHVVACHSLIQRVGMAIADRIFGHDNAEGKFEFWRLSHKICDLAAGNVGGVFWIKSLPFEHEIDRLMRHRIEDKINVPKLPAIGRMAEFADMARDQLEIALQQFPIFLDHEIP